MASPLARRLPILIVVGLGLLLWRSSLFPQPHTLVWERPVSLAIASAEVQLWRGDVLLARAEWPDASHGALTQQLTLRGSPVRALTFVRLRNGGVLQGVQTLALGGEEVVHAALVPEPDRPALTGAERGR